MAPECSLDFYEKTNIQRNGSTKYQNGFFLQFFAFQLNYFTNISKLKLKIAPKKTDTDSRKYKKQLTWKTVTIKRPLRVIEQRFDYVKFIIIVKVRKKTYDDDDDDDDVGRFLLLYISYQKRKKWINFHHLIPNPICRILLKDSYAMEIKTCFEKDYTC